MLASQRRGASFLLVLLAALVVGCGGDGVDLTEGSSTATTATTSTTSGEGGENPGNVFRTLSFPAITDVTGPGDGDPSVLGTSPSTTQIGSSASVYTEYVTAYPAAEGGFSTFIVRFPTAAAYVTGPFANGATVFTSPRVNGVSAVGYTPADGSTINVDTLTAGEVQITFANSLFTGSDGVSSFRLNGVYRIVRP
jgi:hypothetical protein